jgi:hypothetical protein
MAVPSEVRLSPWEDFSQGYIAWRVMKGRHDLVALEIGEPYEEFVFTEGRPARGCLSRFVKLADASDEEIAAFAGQWGVLGFCAEHDLPGAHGSCYPNYKLAVGDWFHDPTDKWRALARRLRAILRVADALLKGQLRSVKDWEALWPGMGKRAEDPHWWTGGEVEAQNLVAAAVTSLVAKSGIAPCVWWHPTKRRYEFGLDLGGSAVPKASAQPRRAPFIWPRGSLYPVLIAQLAAAVTGGKLTRCAWEGCREPFDWAAAGYRRQPRSNVGAYCSEECRKEARRAQKAGWWRKHPQERRVR